MGKENIAELGESVYNTIFSAPSFKRVHNELLNNVIPAIERSNSKNLLVIGIGPSGSPYNTIPDFFNRRFKNKNFKIVFLDNSKDVLQSCFERYKKLGITGEYGLDAQLIIGKFAEQDLENKLTFIQHDIRDSLPTELGKFDVIDSTFTLHHVSQYGQNLELRLNDIYTLLESNGLFHWGTGFCDMGYSEQKIREIGQKYGTCTIIDRRQPDYPYKLEFRPDKYPKITKANGQSDGSIMIDENAIVHISKNFQADKHLFPLIDPKNSRDITHLVQPVQEFYAPTNIEISNLREYGDKLIALAVKGDLNERYNAEKGLNEYYLSEKKLLCFLKHAGFKDIEVKRPNQENGLISLVNIVSYK